MILPLDLVLALQILTHLTGTTFLALEETVGTLWRPFKDVLVLSLVVLMVLVADSLLSCVIVTTGGQELIVQRKPVPEARRRLPHPLRTMKHIYMRLQNVVTWACVIDLQALAHV